MITFLRITSFILIIFPLCAQSSSDVKSVLISKDLVPVTVSNASSYNLSIGYNLYSKAMDMLNELQVGWNRTETTRTEDASHVEQTEMLSTLVSFFSRFVLPEIRLFDGLKDYISSKESSPVTIPKLHADLYEKILASEPDWSFTPDASSHEKHVQAIQMLQVASIRYQQPEALWKLGSMYLFEEYRVQRNASLAFYLIGELASLGNATAQALLGTMYATGVGVRRDYAKAFLYMNLAALGGDPIAEHTLGFWHHAGVTVSKDCNEAAFYYSRVADRCKMLKDESWFQDELDLSSLNPPIVYNSIQEKPGIYKRSLENKQSLTEANGGIYGQGASGSGDTRQMASNGVSLADSELLTYYKLQAETGDATSQLLTGQLYYTGSETIPQNFKRALHYFKLAAKQHPKKSALKAKDVTDALRSTARAASQAIGYIGTMYMRGEGVKENHEKAQKWFERGIAFDCAACFNGLGLMHREGLGVIQKDKDQAAHYFSEAAKREHSGGQINLAEYLLGQSWVDYNKVISLLKAASARGNHRANYFLGKFYFENQQNCPAGLQYLKDFVENCNWHDSTPERAYKKYVEKDYESSFLHYLFAAERGWAIAQLNGAWLLDQGIYRSSNPSQLLYTPGPNTLWDPYESAIVLWNRAANQDNVDARVKLGDYHYYGRGIRSQPMHNLTASSIVKRPPFSESFFKNIFEKLGIRTTLPGWHPLVPDYGKAVTYYEVAAERQYSSIAMFNLGYLYEHGLGVEQDLYLAKRWYDLSSSTNVNAYFPANLALLKLGCKFLIIIIQRPSILLQWYFPTVLNALNEYLGLGEYAASHSSATQTSRTAEAVTSVVDDMAPPIPEDNAGETHGLDEEGSDSGDGALLVILLGMATLLVMWRQQILRDDARRNRNAPVAAPLPRAQAPPASGDEHAVDQQTGGVPMASSASASSSSNSALPLNDGTTSSGEAFKRRPYSSEKEDHADE